MNRFLAANGAEIARADAKAAVLLGFMGAVLGAFLTLDRGTASSRAHTPLPVSLLWWSAVTVALLAIVCFVCAIAPRRHGARSVEGPGYFEHIAPETDSAYLCRAFARVARDPTGPLTASLRRTSAIVRAKYRWIEKGTAL
ncbi:hypothetical protein KDA82_36345, partial [Streptomyces daliensis]|nr:hypothetical protein [Streptomyces daliensis]